MSRTLFKRNIFLVVPGPSKSADEINICSSRWIFSTALYLKYQHFCYSLQCFPVADVLIIMYVLSIIDYFIYYVCSLENLTRPLLNHKHVILSIDWIIIIDFTRNGYKNRFCFGTKGDWKKCTRNTHCFQKLNIVKFS